MADVRTERWDFEPRHVSGMGIIKMIVLSDDIQRSKSHLLQDAIKTLWIRRVRENHQPPLSCLGTLISSLKF